MACAFVLGAALALAPAPARADISLEGGAAVSGGKAGAAGALSLGLLNLPLVPLAGELTVAVPFNGGYATTFDARLSFAGTAIGAGAGFGTLGATNRTGAIYDALLAPHGARSAPLLRTVATVHALRRRPLLALNPEVQGTKRSRAIG